RLIVHSSSLPSARDSVALTFAANTFDNNPLKIKVVVESAAQDRGLEQTVSLKNWTSGKWEQIDRRVISAVDSTLTITPTGDLRRFVDPATNKIEGQLSYGFRTGRDARTTVQIDTAKFLVTR